MCSRSSPREAVGKLEAEVKSQPLRSVENKIHHQELLGGKQPKTETNSGKMSNNCTAMSTNLKIKDEPFTDNYTVEKEIGRGKFAVVKLCRHKKQGRQFAAKFLRKRRKGKDCRHEVVHEIAMLEVAMVHPRLVDLVEVYETSHELILVTEYACGGELYQTVVLEERLHEKHVIRMMRQVLEGVQFLHDRNIVHLDVKPNNIVLTAPYPHGDVKLCDFGFARTVNSGDDIRDIIGTPDYVAPEVLSYEPINTASDMWSIGVLAYVMLTGYSPFAGDTKQETFLNISQVNLDFPDDLFEDISLDAQDFISKLLCRDPEERMSAKECTQHRWLQTDDTLMEFSTGVSALGVASKSPYGSPIGQRRALTPTTPDSSLELEPTKKCRCDSGNTSTSSGTNHDMVNSNDSLDHLNDTENNTKLNPECLNCSGDQTKLATPSSCATTSPLKENTTNTVGNNSCTGNNSCAFLDNSVNELQRENFNNEKTSTSSSHAPKIEDLRCETKNNRLSQDKSARIGADSVEY